MNRCNKNGEPGKDKEKKRKQKISSAKKEEEPSTIASTSSDKIASEPNPKKSKMEKGLPATHEKVPEEELTVSTDSSFESILKASTFVDKTLLIKNVFQTDILYKTEIPKVMITAPRRFGKSVNLDMFRCFVELEVNEETGDPITTVDLKSETAVRDTPNYKLFTVNKNSEEMHLQIMTDDEFVKTHFGKYPIIQVDFLCSGDATSKTDAVNLCRTSIHEAFKKHRYLYKNSNLKLEVDERSVCEQWCTKDGNRNYEQFKPRHVMKGLKDLSEYLNKVHGRKVFVLIDEFDSIVSKAVGTGADKDKLKKIIEFVMDVIGSVVKGNDANLAGVLITGILDLHGISTLMDNLQRDAFGDDTACLKYYGFNLEEVEKLFEIFSVDEGLRKKAITKYNSYYTKLGEHGIFNPYAIVRFLQNHRSGDASLRNYWQESGYVQSLDNIFKKDNVKEMIQRLLLGEWFPANFLNELNPENLTQLHIANKNSEANISADLVRLFLLRQGYLSYIPKKESLPTSLPTVGIPDDLRPVFIKKMVSHLILHYGMSDIVLEDCQSQLNNLMHVANKDKAKKALQSFIRKLSELIKTTYVDPDHEAGIKTVVSSIVLAAGYTCSNQVYNGDQKIPLVIAHKDGQGIIIELNYKTESSSDALTQIFTQGYYKNFINEKYYDGSDIKLRLAMGLHFTDYVGCIKIKGTVDCLRDVEINEVLEELNIEKMDRKGTEIVTEVRIAMACAEEEGINSFVEKALKAYAPVY